MNTPADDSGTPKDELPPRERYEPPSLAVIDLAADQVLGFGCKGGASPSAFMGLCAACSGEGS